MGRVGERKRRGKEEGNKTKQNWSTEIYTISDVIQKAGVVWYKLKNSQGEKVDGIILKQKIDRAHGCDYFPIALIKPCQME